MTMLSFSKPKMKKISVDVRFDEETVWLTLDQIAALFERDKSQEISYVMPLLMKQQSNKIIRRMFLKYSEIS